MACTELKDRMKKKVFNSKKQKFAEARRVAKDAFIKFSVRERQPLVASYIAMVGGAENDDLDESGDLEGVLKSLLEVTKAERQDISVLNDFRTTFTEVYTDENIDETVQRAICTVYGEHCTHDKDAIDPDVTAILDKPQGMMQSMYPAIANTVIQKASAISLLSYDTFGTDPEGRDAVFLKTLSRIGKLDLKKVASISSKFVDFFISDPADLTPHFPAFMQIFECKGASDVDVQARLVGTREFRRLWLKVEPSEHPHLAPYLHTCLKLLFVDPSSKVRAAAYAFLWELRIEAQEIHVGLITDILEPPSGGSSGGDGSSGGHRARQQRASISSISSASKLPAGVALEARRDACAQFANISKSHRVSLLKSFTSLLYEDDSDTTGIRKEACATFFNLEEIIGEDGTYARVHQLLEPRERVPLVNFFQDLNAPVRQEAYKVFANLAKEVRAPYLAANEAGFLTQCVEYNDEYAIRKDALTAFFELDAAERTKSPSMQKFFALAKTSGARHLFCEFFPKMTQHERERHLMEVTKLASLSATKGEPGAETVRAAALQAFFQLETRERILIANHRSRGGKGKKLFNLPFAAESKETSVKVVTACARSFGLLSVDEREPHLNRFYAFLFGKETHIGFQNKSGMQYHLSNSEKQKIQLASCASFHMLTPAERGNARMKEFLEKMVGHKTKKNKEAALASFVELIPKLTKDEYAFLTAKEPNAQHSAHNSDNSDLLSKHFLSLLESRKPVLRANACRGFFKLAEAHRDVGKWCPKLLEDKDEEVLKCTAEGIAGLPVSIRGPLLVLDGISQLLELCRDTREPVVNAVKALITQTVIHDLQTNHFLENAYMPGVSIDLSACCKELRNIPKDPSACKTTINPVLEYISKIGEEKVLKVAKVTHQALDTAKSSIGGGGIVSGKQNIASTLKAAKRFLERYMAPLISGCDQAMVQPGEPVLVLLTKMFMAPIEKLIQETRDVFIEHLLADVSGFRETVQSEANYNKTLYEKVFKETTEKEQHSYTEMLRKFDELEGGVDTSKRPVQPYKELIALTSAVRGNIPLFRNLIKTLTREFDCITVSHRGLNNSNTGDKFTLVGQDTKGLYRMMEKTLLKPPTRQAAKPAVDGADGADAGGAAVAGKTIATAAVSGDANQTTSAGGGSGAGGDGSSAPTEVPVPIAVLNVSEVRHDYSKLLDVSGCMITCISFTDMTGVLKSMVAMHHSKHNSFEIVRFKHRWQGATKTGWRDFMINVKVNGVIFEVQLVHKAMLTVREDLDGHEGYEEIRSIMELFNYQQLEIGIVTDDAQLQAKVRQLETQLEALRKENAKLKQENEALKGTGPSSA